MVATAQSESAPSPQTMIPISDNVGRRPVSPILYVVLAITLAICVLGPYLLLSAYNGAQYRTVPPSRPTKFPRLINLATLRRSAGADRYCAPTPAFAQVREFFQSDETATRSSEIVTALTQTMRNNICARFVLVLSDPEYLPELQRIQAQYDVDMDVWWSPAQVTYDMLLLAVQMTNPHGLFVLSTADVVIPDAAPLFGICPNAFRNGTELLAVSRRDPGLQDCTAYVSMLSSDVFIGNATMIDDYVLHNTRYAPVYWGIENVLMHVLLRGKKVPYNLCPYVDVIHHHASRGERSSATGRIRINHPDNSQNSWNHNLHEVCDLEALKKQYPKFSYKRK